MLHAGVHVRVAKELYRRI